MPGLPYLFDAALSFNNKQNSPRGQRFTSKPAGFGCRHSTENLKHYKKRLCTGFLAFATIVTALPSTVVHAERKQYWTQSNERVGIVEKVMNDGSIGSTFNEGHLTVEGEDAYCIDINTDFIIDEVPAQVVRDIYRWYVEDGMSKIGIVRHLNELGVPTPMDYKHSQGLNLKTPNQAKNDGMWGISTIARILSNRMYIGDMVQGKQRVISYKVHKAIATPESEWFIVENTHEPIIDKVTFEMAQSLSQRDTRTAPTKRNVYLFSGFLRCADCDKSMTKKTNKKNMANGETKEYTYYVCSTYALKNKDKCSRHSISLEDLTEAVLNAIQVQISLVCNMAEVITEINKQEAVCNQSLRLTKQLQTKEHELEKITNVIDNLYMDWKCGEITRAEYVRMKAKFEAKADSMKNAIVNLKAEIELSSKGVGNNDPYLQMFLKHKNITELNRGILAELIDTIYIHENNEITIKFNFADQHKRLLDFISNNQNTSKKEGRVYTLPSLSKSTLAV